MRIAVDTRFLHSDEMPELRNFTREVFGQLAVQHPEHEFIFFTDSASYGDLNSLKNVTTITITPKPTNVLLHKWWYDVRLSLALKKYKANIFIATYGLASLTTSIPQILIVRDLAFLKKRIYSPRNNYFYYKKYSSAFIKKSKSIVTLSNFVKEELAARYQVKKEAVQTLGSGTSASFKPIEWEEREEIKAQFAQGCEYFVFTGGLHPRANLLNLLKAFSIFKKWQKTNMKLVITGRFDTAFEKELDKLNSYKYRNEVFIKRDLSQTEMSAVVAASYAMIFPSYYEGLAMHVLDAIQCEVPLITSGNSSMSEIAGDAALYADPAKPEEIAEQMKKIFKDEQLRNKLIEAAKGRAKLFSWNKTAALLWQVIEQVVSK
ncbi:MAG: glycosyltransferase family 1 protein [Segetibacter sp.]|nr:glycosyltransferase family 1 protein [Segetibacter sp.]